MVLDYNANLRICKVANIIAREEVLNFEKS